MNRFISIIPVFCALIACGCTVMKYSEGIGTLQDLSRAGEEIETYLVSQEEGFCRLQQDAASGVFPDNISKTEAIAVYGEPVFSRPVDDIAGAGEVLLYRHPTDFFGSDRFYLYFDSEKQLTSWEHVPAR